MTRLPVFSFSYLPLVIRLKCEQTGTLPHFLGSTLRGALGWMLLQSESEAYAYLFDNQQARTKQHIVKPYIIEPPRAKEQYRKGDYLQFSFILLGDASRYVSEVIHSFTQIDRLGLGAQRLSFSVDSITHGETLATIWCKAVNQVELSNIAPVPLLPETQRCEHLFLQLQTPLRIRRKGQLVTELDFPTLVRNITTRIMELTERYGGSADEVAIQKICEQSQTIHLDAIKMEKYEMSRYSNRQNEKMDFSGILGTVAFSGDLTPFSAWLNLARILHLGRNTTFGCGKIELVIM